MNLPVRQDVPPEFGQPILDDPVRVIEDLGISREFELHGEAALPAPRTPEKQVQFVL